MGKKKKKPDGRFYEVELREVEPGVEVVSAIYDAETRRQLTDDEVDALLGRWSRGVPDMPDDPDAKAEARRMDSAGGQQLRKIPGKWKRADRWWYPPEDT